MSRSNLDEILSDYKETKKNKTSLPPSLNEPLSWRLIRRSGTPCRVFHKENHRGIFRPKNIAIFELRNTTEPEWSR